MIQYDRRGLPRQSTAEMTKRKLSYKAKVMIAIIAFAIFIVMMG